MLQFIVEQMGQFGLVHGTKHIVGYYALRLQSIEPQWRTSRPIAFKMNELPFATIFSQVHEPAVAGGELVTTLV